MPEQLQVLGGHEQIGNARPKDGGVQQDRHEQSHVPAVQVFGYGGIWVPIW